MLTKRTIDVIDEVPSPRRLTRASARMEIVDESKKADACKMGARRKLHDKERSDEPENVKRGKAKVEENDPAEKQAEKDVRKKGSASKLIKINRTLEEDQKGIIAAVGFGGLLEIKCMSVLEKLSLWLINKFATDKSEIVLGTRGSIKVDALAVNRVFGLPMGPMEIEYGKRSGADTFVEF
ncbi:unnamed protein product [Urochloa decumbens]|uniref:Uncharacterized protein n=1 Tax=Urochloa decumbens TaxID=240449 RepID=A0ABC8WCY6_9POAL